MYIELFASRPPLTFQKSNDSFKKERNVERKILGALQSTMGGLEETLWGFIKTNSPLALIIIVISDYNEDEVEVIIIERKTFQLVGLEHLITFDLGNRGKKIN